MEGVVEQSVRGRSKYNAGKNDNVAGKNDNGVGKNEGNRVRVVINKGIDSVLK